MKLPLALFLCFLPVVRADDVLASAVFNPRDADPELARAVTDHSAVNKPLRIAEREFARGLGTQVDTRIAFEVGGATRFSTRAGVDDATDEPATVRFEIVVDGASRWRRDLRSGEPAVPIEVDLSGAKQIVLLTSDIGNAFTHAYADWVEPTFAVQGAAPKSVLPPAVVEKPEILTPAPSAAPQINGPRVIGVRPGHPFLFQIAATGARPMTFTAVGLPDGLALEAATGRITGTLTAAGPFRVALRANNSRGEAEAKLRIEVGETIALTPPMGWNSWNCWGVSVDQDKVLASARAMVDKGLAEHGWSYVNIDDTWQGQRTGPGHALQGNAKFPDLKKLCDEIHALGLHAGIYSTPWETSYASYAGGSSDDPAGAWSKKLVNENGRKRRHFGEVSFADADAKQWAAWGMDYLKYDWNPRNSMPPETAEQFREHIATMARALRESGRDIVYSYSNSFPFDWIGDDAILLNAWRTTGDIHDSWGSLRGIWLQQEKWRKFAGPGHWNDPDMLVVGPVDVGSGRNIRPSRLTPNEQYTHISLWCLLSAPLLIGCPLERLDPFTLNLLTNDEVLALDQDERGAPAAQTLVDGRTQIYVKELADGSYAIGLFNLAQEPQAVSAAWSELKLTPPKRARDLWRQADVPVDHDKVSALVPRHGVVLLRVWGR